ncbi:MAG: hypothetical protein ABIH00_11385 [Armatimonadota bacterium]
MKRFKRYLKNGFARKIKIIVPEAARIRNLKIKLKLPKVKGIKIRLP